LGSIVAVFMVYAINTQYKSASRQGLIFLLFAAVGTTGALFSWAYLPDIQRRTPDGKLVNRNLEELGGGLQAAEAEEQIFTARGKMAALHRRLRGRA
jgi:MFS transporter, PHS family, inorganic phosphate transporter